MTARCGRLLGPSGHRRPRFSRGRGPATEGRAGALPLGLQQPLPQSHDHLRRQQPTRQPLGKPHLPTSRRPRATTTRTPSASSPAPGSASFTDAGSTASPTTRHGTATPPNSTRRSPREVDTEGVMSPTSGREHTTGAQATEIGGEHRAQPESPRQRNRRSGRPVAPYRRRTSARPVSTKNSR